MSPPAWLREYTVRFGFAVTDMFEELTAAARGAVSLPEVLPSAMASFEAMPEECVGLEFAKLSGVFDYLRRGKYLQIPRSWSHLIPKATMF